MVTQNIFLQSNLSPMITLGMKKDPDGFMDIEWCLSKVITDW